MPLFKSILKHSAMLGLACVALCRSLFKPRRSFDASLSTDQTNTWRSRLALATLLFSAWWSVRGAQASQGQDRPAAPKERKGPPRVTCYKVAAPIPPWNRTLAPSFLKTLRAAWLVLDSEKGEEFRQKVQEGVKSDQFTRSIGDFLTLAYKEIAYHKARTDPDRPPITCYKMTPLGGIIREVRENALNQIELLRKASKDGKLDEVTVQKVKRTLARDLDLLKEARECADALKWNEADRLSKDYHGSDLPPTSQALDAAAIIAEMEKGS